MKKERRSLEKSRIQAENISLVKRLQNPKSQYSYEKLSKNMADHKRWLKIICKKPYVLDKFTRISELKQNVTPQQKTGSPSSTWKNDRNRSLTIKRLKRKKQKPKSPWNYNRKKRKNLQTHRRYFSVGQKKKKTKKPKKSRSSLKSKKRFIKTMILEKNYLLQQYPNKQIRSRSTPKNEDTKSKVTTNSEILSVKSMLKPKRKRRRRVLSVNHKKKKNSFKKHRINHILRNRRKNKKFKSRKNVSFVERQKSLIIFQKKDLSGNTSELEDDESETIENVKEVGKKEDLKEEEKISESIKEVID